MSAAADCNSSFRCTWAGVPFELNFKTPKGFAMIKVANFINPEEKEVRFRQFLRISGD
jgi:hypothetical protein